MSVRAKAVAVVAAGLTLLVGGCSGSGSSSSTGTGASSGSGAGTGAGTGSAAGSGTGSSTGSGASGSGSSVQLTGTQLSKAMLPASDFPASFAVSQQGSSDSGSSLEKTAASYNLTTLTCTDWDNYFTSSGFGETAYSSASVANHTLDQSYGQLVYQFSSSSAASQFFDGVRSLSGRCGSFTASGAGTADKVTMQAVTAPTVSGHQALWIDQTATVVGTSSKRNVLFALDGSDVLAITVSGVGTALPSDPAPSTLMAKLIASIQAQK